MYLLYFRKTIYTSESGEETDTAVKESRTIKPSVPKSPNPKVSVPKTVSKSSSVESDTPSSPEKEKPDNPNEPKKLVSYTLIQMLFREFSTQNLEILSA